MFRKVSSLALAICALGSGLIAAETALADGWWGRGSIKDYVPVPAPAPIPDHAASWYLRADLGVGFASADPSESGVVYGQNLYGPPSDTSPPFGTRSGWSEDDAEATFSYGAGFGYYWSPSFRTDLTLEGRPERKLRIRGTYDYAQWSNGAPNDNIVEGQTNDVAELNSGLLLFNAYFDLVRDGSLTPYVGAGVGLAVNKLERTFANNEEIYNGLGDLVDTRSTRVSDSTHDATFAAALMAGLSYSISPVSMLDLNYRYLYIGSSDLNLYINGVKSNFSTGDTHEHQIRVGLRWNIQ